MAQVITKKNKNIVRERMLKSAIAYLRFKGYRDIKTSLKGFDDPQAIFLKASDAGHVPDLIAQKDFGTYIFELYDADDEVLPTERWDIYTTYTERKDGRFYLIAYDEDIPQLNEQLAALNVEPGILSIRR